MAREITHNYGAHVGQNAMFADEPECFRSEPVYDPGL